MPLQKVYQLKSGQAVLQLAGTAPRKLNSFITSRIISSLYFLLDLLLFSSVRLFCFFV